MSTIPDATCYETDATAHAPRIRPQPKTIDEEITALEQSNGGSLTEKQRAELKRSDPAR